MKFRIDSQIFKNYPGTIIGVVWARNIDNYATCSKMNDLLRAEEARIKSSYESETLSQDLRIAAWRKVYSSFGVKSKDARSSVENLYKMVLRGVQLRRINKLVDIYNYICLKYMVPVGGEDIDKMVGDLQLTFAKTEKPVKLLGDAEPEAPVDGEVIYKDDDSTICRRWNWREAERTKLTEQTRNAILVVEAIPPVTAEDLAKAVDELAQLVKKYCGGVIITELLFVDKKELSTQ